MKEYRGFRLDSVRHFQSTDEIKKLIDAIALLGFNKFHWHLTDDQGWRFASDRFPRLNAAAVRPYSDFGKALIREPYGRLYSKDEMRDIVSYCSGKGIEVIPEIEMPGHTGALLSAFPSLSCGGKKVRIKTHQGVFRDVLCIAREETFETVTALIDEFLEIFPGEFFHIGGDETPPDHWKSCPDCQRKMRELGLEDYSAYQNIFMNRVIDYLAGKGRRAIVWNDSVKGGNLDKRAIIQYWKERDRASVDFINSGGRAILSPFSYCYLDYDYSITPLNRVYSLKPSLRGLTDEGKKNILGLEAPIWTEYIDNDEKLERLLFPRIIAVSKAALGENDGPYEEFLREIKEMRGRLGGYVFEDERRWTKTRLSYAAGWLRFVRDNYTAGYIREQLFGKDYLPGNK